MTKDILSIIIFSIIFQSERSDGINLWENTIDNGDTYFLQYQSHSTIIKPTKRIKMPEKDMSNVKGKWELHEKTSKSRYSFSANLSDSPKPTLSTTVEPYHFHNPGVEYEYPNVVPYNQILVPKSFYAKNKLTQKRDHLKRSSKVSSALKNKRKNKHELYQKHKNWNRKESKSKLRRTKKSSKNPIKNFFRGVYYQYFSQKDRQLGPDVYPLVLGWGGIIAFGMGSLAYLATTSQLASNRRQLDDIEMRISSLEGRIDSVARASISQTYSLDTCPTSCTSLITDLSDKITTLESTTETLTTTTGTLSTRLGTLETSALATCNKVKEITEIAVGTGMTAEAAYVMDVAAITDPSCS